MRKPPHRQITLIINRAEGVVVIYVNLCHILSHHFLALTTKRKSMIKLKPEQKGTFKSTAGLTFSPNLKSSREIFYEKWRQRRRVSYVAVSCWNRAESEKDTWDQFSPSNFTNLCHKQLFPLLLKIIVCLWGSHVRKEVKGWLPHQMDDCFSKYPKEGGDLSPLRASFK